MESNKIKKNIPIIEFVCLFLTPVTLFFFIISLNSNYLINRALSYVLITLCMLFVGFIIFSIIYKFINRDYYKQIRRIKLKIFAIICLSIYSIAICVFLCFLYIPNSKFKNFLITSAMTTFSHQYIAKIFYNDKTIDKVMDNNIIVESNIDTNVNLINFDTKNINNNKYLNEYDKEILERDEDALYKIIDIKGNGYNGKLVAIYDASKVSIATSQNIGKSGQLLTDISKNNNAVIAMNASGFWDPGFNSNGGEVLGMVISSGSIIMGKNNNNVGGGMIGFDNQNRLILSSTMSAQEALNKGIRDAISFGPFLIVNGIPSFIKGDGGWGIAPRSVIAQRKDGIVLFLAINGRDYANGIIGASMTELTNILMNYGAYNAANLDGGTSSGLTLNHELINKPINAYGENKTRRIPNAWIVKSDK